MLAAKNSRKRIEARSLAAVTSAGIWPCGVVNGTRLQATAYDLDDESRGGRW
jgi:hypothetical protein